MSKVIIDSLIIVEERHIKGFCEEFGYTCNINKQGKGRFIFSTTPDLTAGHKTQLQKMIDAVGRGTIS